MTTIIRTKTYTGSSQTDTAPTGATTLLIQCYGGGGAGGEGTAFYSPYGPSTNYQQGGTGGYGALASGIFTCAAGDVVTCYPGQGGQAATISSTPNPQTPAGGSGSGSGYNGGGAGYRANNGGGWGNQGGGGGGGGGAASMVVSTSGTIHSTYGGNLVIAGGGGGAGGGMTDGSGIAANSYTRNGGSGGHGGQTGNNGANGTNSAGTAVGGGIGGGSGSGGAAGATAGSISDVGSAGGSAAGGAGSTNARQPSGGGGGGGYGGGGAAANSNNTTAWSTGCPGGGGGGSFVHASATSRTFSTGGGASGGGAGSTGSSNGAMGGAGGVGTNGSIVLTYTAIPSAPAIVSPTGGSILFKSPNQSFSWTAATPPTGVLVGALQYNLDISYNSGGAWSTLVALTSAGATSYVADLSAATAGPNTRWRIRAWDGTHFGPYATLGSDFIIAVGGMQLLL